MKGSADQLPAFLSGEGHQRTIQEKLSYDDDEPLLEPYSYLLQVPGKRIRSRLIDAFDRWLKIPPDIKQEVKRIVQMLHTASLLIDDIEDNSNLRRGIPTAHCVYGIPSTINCANYVYFLALQRCVALGNQKAVSGFLEEMVKLHQGQGWDIFWRDNMRCPTEQEYKAMVLDKTGGLFRLAIKIMSAFSECELDFVPLVNKLGLFFQIQDDYMNLHSLEYTKNKSFCEDLTEGKFSFPIIHAIASNPGDHRLMNILKLKTHDENIKKYAVSYMAQCKSFEYTRSVLKQTEAEIDEILASLGGNKAITKIVRFLSSRIDQDDTAVGGGGPPEQATKDSPPAKATPSGSGSSEDSGEEEEVLRAAFKISADNVF